MSDQNHNNVDEVLTSPNSNPNSNVEFTLRILTLNCWGLWLGAKKRRKRIEGIVRYLREINCDIVFLQEIWVSTDFETIRNNTQDLYKFAHLYRSGSVLGSSGIVILCKWLPKVVHFEPYSLNGSPFYPWHGDWFAGKGIAYTRVDFDGLSLHLFSTHTHAYYKENEPVHDQYSIHRVCQSYQLARFITFISDTACSRKTDGKDLFIVAGDMNSTSSQLPYKILTTMAGLTDCFKASRYNSHSSNIIHKHKLMAHRQKLHLVDDSSMSSITSLGESVSFVKNKLSDNILETFEEYKNKVAQVLFDSDTDDEDITYCHPRNSFTPGSYIDSKQIKKLKNLTIPSSTATTASLQETSSSSTSKEVKSIDETSFKFERSSSDRSSAKQSNALDIDSQKTRRSKNSPMKRIDFILCRLLTHGHCVVDRIATESTDTSLDCSLSDHEPVMVELKISDLSHDLVERNHIKVSEKPSPKAKFATHSSDASSRPLISVVDSQMPQKDCSELEETTNQWVPEKAPVSLSQAAYKECNIQVLEETKDILTQYHRYNRTSKTQLFYVALFMFIVTLPTTTYYALSNDLIPISTIIFMWFATSFLFGAGFLIGYLSYRFEQGAIEAILNDITCKISVAKYDQI